MGSGSRRSDELPATTGPREPAPPSCNVIREPYGPDLWARVGPAWTNLYERVADASPFLHPLWVGTWLESFGPAVKPDALLFETGGTVIGIGLLIRRRTWRGPVPVRRWFLNTAGEPQGQEVCAEHQRLLHAAGYGQLVATAFVRTIASGGWDEMMFDGFEPSAYRTLAEPLTLPADERWSVDYYVDLDDLRQRQLPYLESRSRNTREQVRRSLRRYTAAGPVTIRPAASASEARAMLSELIDLHTRTWTARGERGAFAGACARSFHERLVTRGVDEGYVTMLRASAGADTIGVLYVITERRRACFYQSGLRYTGDNRDKPGLVCHALAIEAFEARQFAEYDFLAGEHVPVRYKQSLATSTRRLGWIAVQRPTLATKAVAALRRIKRRLRTGAPAASPPLPADPA